MKPVRLLLGISIGTISLVALTGGVVAATVNSCDDTSLRTALAAGGTITFDCDGVIVLTNSLTITASTTLDGTGRDVSISGNNLYRHFNVQPGAALTLRNLNFISGRAFGANGTNFIAAKPGFGGSILLQDAELVAVDCRFSDNQTKGGTGVSFQWGQLPGFPTAGGHAYGGAIFATNSHIRLTNVVFLRNSCAGGPGGTISNAPGPPPSGPTGQGLGGAINLESGSLSVISNLLAGNSAFGQGAFGGAIHLATGTLAVTSSLLTSNAALGTPSFGGAIHAADGTVTLQQSQFSRNAAFSGSQSESRGGAISLRAGLLRATNCLVLSNRVAGGDGGYSVIGGFSGGLGYGGGVASMSSAVMVNCAVIDNAASGGNLPSPCCAPPPRYGSAGSGFGGGIFNSGEISLLNCTLAGNASIAGTNHLGPSTPGNAFGGALANAGTSSLAFVTIASNRAERRPNPPGSAEGVARGGGIYNQTSAVVTVQACIVANSLSGSNGFGLLTDLGHCLSSDLSCSFTGSGSLNGIAPKLGPLADNGGSTPTMALLPGSPAIDAAGTSALAPTDQRGVLRPGLAQWDIGAYELVPDYFFLSSIQKMPSQSLRFRGWGIPDRSFSLMGATEMTNWMMVGEGAVGTNGLFETLVPGETASLGRIFRTVSQ